MSKELKALKRIENFMSNNAVHWKQDIAMIETALKALEIIKEKGNFISPEYNEFSGKYYIYDNELYMRNEITKEEYELLKEVGL